ncbi:MAG: hypothetical protein EA367_18350, partial [Leptolyngbya sp. DLM2.Bin15]
MHLPFWGDRLDDPPFKIEEFPAMLPLPRIQAAMGRRRFIKFASGLGAGFALSLTVLSACQPTADVTDSMTNGAGDSSGGGGIRVGVT